MSWAWAEAGSGRLDEARRAVDDAWLAHAFSLAGDLLRRNLGGGRRVTRFEIQDTAIWKVAELMAYAMFLNLFLLGAEVFKEFYLPTHHSQPAIYLYFGLKGHTALVPWIWTAITMNLIGTLTALHDLEMLGDFL